MFVSVYGLVSSVCIDQVGPYISSGLYRYCKTGRPIDELPCSSEPNLAPGHISTLFILLRLGLREIRARPKYQIEIDNWLTWNICV